MSKVLANTIDPTSFGTVWERHRGSTWYANRTYCIHYAKLVIREKRALPGASAREYAIFPQWYTPPRYKRA